MMHRVANKVLFASVVLLVLLSGCARVSGPEPATPTPDSVYPVGTVVGTYPNGNEWGGTVFLLESGEIGTVGHVARAVERSTTYSIVIDGRTFNLTGPFRRVDQGPPNIDSIEVAPSNAPAGLTNLVIHHTYVTQGMFLRSLTREQVSFSGTTPAPDVWCKAFADNPEQFTCGLETPAFGLGPGNSGTPMLLSLPNGKRGVIGVLYGAGNEAHDGSWLNVLFVMTLNPPFPPEPMGPPAPPPAE